jgi:hypothetical protein
MVMLGFKSQLLPTTGSFHIEYPAVCLQPYGAMSPVACEELWGCSVYCGWN